MSAEEESETFGPYAVHECLGAGGMAVVYRASIDNGAGVRREIALKRLLPQLVDDTKLVADFIREAKLSAQLQHPNIVKIVELGQVDDEYFIAMELIAGAPLMKMMRRADIAGAPAPIGVVISILMELLDALDYAHNGTGAYGEPLGIVHRDVSPSNLIITDDGHVKVIDFGVAKALAGRFMTNTGLVKGKLGYMSPESLTGLSIDARADLFATGVIAWELLTAQRLFRGDNELDTIRRIRSEPVARPSIHNRDCPGGLDALVLKALARSRDARWSSAAEMRAALDVVRRPYRHVSDPSEVAKWKDALLTNPRLLTDAGFLEEDSDRGEDTATTRHRALVDVQLETRSPTPGDDAPPLHPPTYADYDEPSEPSIEYSIDPPDPVIRIVPTSDTLDEPVPGAAAGEDGPSGIIEREVLDNLGEPLSGPSTVDDDGPWSAPSRDTEAELAAWDDTT